MSWWNSWLSPGTIERLGWMLVHGLWQVTAVAVLLAILLRLLHKTSANVRYAIACSALALTVALPVVTTPWIRVAGPVAEAGPPPTVVPARSASTVMPEVPATGSKQLGSVEYSHDGTRGERPANSPISQYSVNSVFYSPPVPLRERVVSMLKPALPCVVLGWLVGVFGLSAWHLGGWTQLQRLRRRMVRTIGEPLQQRFEELSVRLGVRQAVGLLESALVEVPTVVGWLRPVILLPASALTGLRPEQLEAILAHELAHIRRYDYLVNMLQAVVEILGFYHPAIWWISHRVRIERENCCDDLAVHVCGNSLQYARALACMEEIRHHGSDLAVAASGGSLLARIARLLGRPVVEDRRFAWLPGLITLLLVTALIVPAAVGLSTVSSPKAGTAESLALLRKMTEDADPNVSREAKRLVDTRTNASEPSSASGRSSSAGSRASNRPEVQMEVTLVEIMADQTLDATTAHEVAPLLGRIPLGGLAPSVAGSRSLSPVPTPGDICQIPLRDVFARYAPTVEGCGRLLGLLVSGGYAEIVTRTVVQPQQGTPLKLLIGDTPDASVVLSPNVQGRCGFSSIRLTFVQIAPVEAATARVSVLTDFSMTLPLMQRRDPVNTHSVLDLADGRLTPVTRADVVELKGDDGRARLPLVLVKAVISNLPRAGTNADQDYAALRQEQMSRLTAPEVQLHEARSAIRFFEEHEDWEGLATAYEAAAEAMWRVTHMPPEAFVRPVPPPEPPVGRFADCEVQTELDGVWQPSRSTSWTDWIRRKQKEMVLERITLLKKLGELCKVRLNSPARAAAAYETAGRGVPLCTEPLDKLLPQMWPKQTIAAQDVLALDVVGAATIRTQVLDALADAEVDTGNLRGAAETRLRAMLGSLIESKGDWNAYGSSQEAEAFWKIVRCLPLDEPLPPLLWLNLLDRDKPALDFPAPEEGPHGLPLSYPGPRLVIRPGQAARALTVSADMETPGGFGHVRCFTMIDGKVRDLGSVAWYQDHRKGREWRADTFDVPQGAGIIRLEITPASGNTFHVRELKVSATFAPGPNEVSLQSFQNARYFWQQAEIGKKLIERGDKSFIPELVKMLSAEDRRARCNAGMVLAGLGDERGLQAVIAELQDREARPTQMRRSDGKPDIPGQIRSDRYYAAHVLGDIHDKRGVSALLPVLAEPSINLAAAWSLGEIRDPQALPALRAMLERADADPTEKLCAADAMAKIGDPTGVPALVKLLQSPHWSERRNTAEALGKLRDRRAVAGLIESSQDVSPDVQVASARALGQIGDPAALPALRNLLTNNTISTSGPPQKLSDVAAEAIEQIRTADFALTQASSTQEAAGSETPSGTPADTAVPSALREIWDKLDALDAERLELARQRWEALPITDQAQRILRDWTQRGPSEEQRQAMMDQDNARQFLAQVQKQLGTQWPSHLRGHMEALLTPAEREQFNGRRKALVQEVAALGEPVVKTLVHMVGTESLQPAGAAANEALRQIGAPAVPALLEAVASTERQPRWALLGILVDLRDPRAADTFRRLLDDPDPHSRLPAFQGLEKLHLASQDLCLRCLEDDYDWLRREAISVLAEIGDEQSIPALFVVAHYDLSGDKTGGLWMREEAFRAIQRISQRIGKAVELPASATWRPKLELTFELLSASARCANAGIRQEAIMALGGRYHDRRTLDLLLTLLKTDPSPKVREAAGAAIAALFYSSNPQDKPLELSQAEREPLFNTLLDMIGDKQTQPSAQSTGVNAVLAAAGPYLPDYSRFPELFAVACRWVEEKDRAVQLAGLHVLSRLGYKHPQALRQYTTPEVRARLLSVLLTGMEDPEVSYRIRFIELLGYLRERSIVPRLIQLLGDANDIIRTFAIGALGEIGDPRAVPQLEQLAQHDSATDYKGEFYLRNYATKAIEKIRAADPPDAATREPKAKESPSAQIQVQTVAARAGAPAEETAAQILLEFRIVGIQGDQRPERALLEEMAQALGDLSPLARALRQPGRELDITLDEVFKRYIVPQSLSEQGFRAAERLLQSQSGTQMLSAPKFVTRDGEQTRMRIGSSAPLPGASGSASGPETVEYGTAITLTGHVLDAERVNLEMAVELSDLVPGPADSNALTVSRTSAETNVTAWNNRYLIWAAVEPATTPPGPATGRQSVYVMLRPGINLSPQGQTATARNGENAGKRPGQVLLEVRSVTSDRGVLSSLNSQWTSRRQMAGSGSSSGTSANERVQLGAIPGQEFTQALLPALDRLYQDHQVDIASQEILAQDGCQAQIKALLEEWFPSRVPTTEGTTPEQTESCKIETGTVLSITPRTVDGSGIAVDLALEISKKLPNASGSALPLITRQVSKSTVMVKDGGTIAVSGLTDNRADPSAGLTRELTVYVTARLVSDDPAPAQPSPLPGEESFSTRVERVLKLSQAAHTSDWAKLADLFAEQPAGSKSYQVRPGVIVGRHTQESLFGDFYYLPDKDVFYVQHDPIGSSTQTYYGPFPGKPAEVLNAPEIEMLQTDSAREAGNRTTALQAPGGVDRTPLDEAQVSSRAWQIMRQWNCPPLLLGLMPQLAKVQEPSRQNDSVWQEVSNGGTLRLRLDVEGDLPGEVVVGLFKDARWSTEPVAVRRLSAGTHVLTGLAPGQYQIGAMLGDIPSPLALGVQRTWPEPVEIKAGQTATAEVLVSEAFQEQATGWHNDEELAKDYLGNWGELKDDSLLQGQLTDPGGKPIAFGEVLIREHRTDNRPFDAPNRGTNEQGLYRFSEIAYPYRVIARWREPLPAAFGCRYQTMSLNRVFEGPQRVDFRFDPFPQGTAKLTGKVLDQNGRPVEGFFFRVLTLSSEKLRQRDELDGKTSTYTGYDVPFFSPDGCFELGGLPEGAATAHVIPFEIKRYESDDFKDVTLAAGQATSLDFRLTGKDVFYGRVLFEDGSPAVLQPCPWRRGTTMIIPRGTRAPASGQVDAQGYFAVYLNKSEQEDLASSRTRLTVNLPSAREHLWAPTGEFPFDKLSQDKRTAGTLLVKRPEPTLTTSPTLAPKGKESNASAPTQRNTGAPRGRMSPGDSRSAAPRQEAGTSLVPTWWAGPWGEAVEGVQMRLRAERVAWRVDEFPALRWDVRNTGTRQYLYVPVNQSMVQLEVDAVWHVWPAFLHGSRLDDLGVGQSVENQLVTLSPMWSPAKPEDLRPVGGGGWLVDSDAQMKSSLALTPGRHTIRLAVVAEPSRAMTGDALRVISAPMDIMITAPEAGGTISRVPDPKLAQAVKEAICGAMIFLPQSLHPEPQMKEQIAQALAQTERAAALADDTWLHASLQQMVNSLAALQQAMNEDPAGARDEFNAVWKAYSRLVEAFSGGFMQTSPSGDATDSARTLGDASGANDPNTTSHDSSATLGTDVPRDLRSSRAWHVMRQANCPPLLLGLAPQLLKALTPARQNDAVWQEFAGGGCLKLDVKVEQETGREIVVGLFADAKWSQEPVAVRLVSHEGTYTLTGLPAGRYQIGAMIGRAPKPIALGVQRTWPQPVEIKPGQTTEAELLVAREMAWNASGGHNEEVSRDYTGDWSRLDENHLLQGRLAGPDGAPIRFGYIQVREYQAVRSGGIAAPDLGTNEAGVYKFDGTQWPYRVNAAWRDTLPDQLGYRYQFQYLNRVFEGPQTVDFRFEPFPPGTAKIVGRTVDQDGRPVTEFFLRVETEFPAALRKGPDGKTYTQIGYIVPFLSADGRFELGGLPEGALKVYAVAFDNRRYTIGERQDVTLKTGETTEIKVEVPHNKLLYGRILFEDGGPAVVSPAPWKGAKTTLRIDETFRFGGNISHLLHDVGEADAEGYVAAYFSPTELEHLRAGSARLTIRLPGKEKDQWQWAGEFPFDRLSEDEAQAGTVTIRRP